MGSRLVDSYSKWRDSAFPLGSTRDDLDEIHADLATVDTWVADMVIPYVEHGTRFPLKVDIEGEIHRIIAELERLRPSAEGDSDLVDSYADYARVLNEVFSAYRWETSHKGQQ